jgi:16S rRNA (uracil1498-N3)-methyltransferase
MKKLFIDYTPENEITLVDEQARHIAKSLRMKVGDMLTVCDGLGGEFGCQIDKITKDTVHLEVCYRQASKAEPSCSVTIYQGVPKSTKMEDIIQKCVELGVVKIVPTLTKRCVSRPDDKSANKKKQRWQKISLESAQQSGRSIVPEIADMQTLKQAIASDESKTKIVFYEGGGEPITSVVGVDTHSVSIYIGPEGGFDKDEVDAIVESGAKQVTLGARILRTQTAPVAGLTAIMLLTGNLE